MAPLLPREKTLHLKDAFERTPATDEAFFHNFLRNCMPVNDEVTTAANAISENVSAFAALLRAILPQRPTATPSHHRRQKQRTNQTRAPSSSERAAHEIKVQLLWDSCLAHVVGQEDADGTRKDETPVKAAVVDGMPCFSLPAPLFWYIAIASLFQFTSTEVLHRLFHRATDKAGLDPFRTLTEFFLHNARTAATHLSELQQAGAADRDASHSGSSGKSLFAWGAAADKVFAPQRFIDGLPAEGLVPCISDFSTFSEEKKLVIETMRSQVKLLFGPPGEEDERRAGEEMPVDEGAEAAAKEREQTRNLHSYIDVFDVTRKVLCGVLSKPPPRDTVTPEAGQKGHIAYNGIPAVIVRHAYLTVADLCDRVLASASSAVAKTPKTDRKGAKLSTSPDSPQVNEAEYYINIDCAKKIQGILEAGTGKTLVLSKKVPLSKQEVDDVESHATDTFKKGMEEADAQGEMSEKSRDKTLEEAEALEIYFTRSEALRKFVKQRCMELVKQEKFVKMVNRTDLPEELLLAFSGTPISDQASKCAAHRQPQKQRDPNDPAAVGKCSRCLLCMWFPFLSDTERELMATEDCKTMEERLGEAIRYGINEAVQSLLELVPHQDALMDLSRTAQTATALQAAIDQYFSNHPELFDWVREKMTAYAHALVDRQQKLDDARREREERRTPHADANVSVQSWTNTYGNGDILAVFEAVNARLSDIKISVDTVLKQHPRVRYVWLLVKGWLTWDVNLRLPGLFFYAAAERIFVVHETKRCDTVEITCRHIFDIDTSGRNGTNGKDGVDRHHWMNRNHTPLDGKDGSDAESGTPGEDGGDVYIHSITSIKFASIATRLRVNTKGGNGGSGGRGGNGENGKNVADADDASVHHPIDEHYSGTSSRFMHRGDWAPNLPGKGGRNGLRGIRGIEGKRGEVCFEPPVPPGHPQFEIITGPGEQGEDGKAGGAGVAGGGGCDGRAYVGATERKWNWWSLSFSKFLVTDENEFYANENCWNWGIETGNTWFRKSIERYSIKPYFIAWSIDHAQYLVNKGRLLQRATFDAKRTFGTTSVCEKNAMNLTAEQQMERDGRLRGALESVVGKLAAARVRKEDSDVYAEADAIVEQDQFLFSDDLKEGVKASLQRVEGLLDGDLAQLCAALQQAETLAEVSEMLDVAAQAAMHVNIHFKGNKETGPTLDDAIAEGGYYGDRTQDDATHDTLQQLFRDAGTKRKGDLHLPVIPCSHFLLKVLPAIELYNKCARQVKKANENIVYCATLLSFVFEEGFASKPTPLLRECFENFYSAMLFQWKNVFFLMRAPDLLDDLYSFRFSASPKYATVKVRPCANAFDAHMVRVLAFHHAHRISQSLNKVERLTQTRHGRDLIARQREKVEKLLTCSVTDIEDMMMEERMKASGTNSEQMAKNLKYPIAAAANRKHIFRLFGPFICTCDAALILSCTGVDALGADAHKELLALTKLAFGQYAFPVEEAGRLHSMCVAYCKVWADMKEAGMSIATRATSWVRSKAAVDVYRFLMACIAALPSAKQAQYPGMGEMGQVLSHVRGVLRYDGDAMGPYIRSPQFDVLYQWRFYLREASSGDPQASRDSLELMYEVLSRQVSAFVAAAGEKSIQARVELMRELLLFIHEWDEEENSDYRVDFEKCNEQQLADVVCRAHARKDLYSTLLHNMEIDYLQSNDPMVTAAYVALQHALRIRLLLFDGVSRAAQICKENNSTEGQKTSVRGDGRQCKECGFGCCEVEKGSPFGLFIPQIPCQQCEETHDPERSLANQLIFLRLFLQYLPHLETSVIAFPDANSHASGLPSGSFSPDEVVKLLWEGCAQRDAANQVQETLSFATFNRNCEGKNVKPFFESVLQFLESPSMERCVHAPFDLPPSQEAARQPLQQEQPSGSAGGKTASEPLTAVHGFPYRAPLHNARRLLNFMATFCNESEMAPHEELMQRLIKRLGDEALHERIGYSSELRHIISYGRAEMAACTLLEACEELLQRYRIEEDLHHFCATVYTKSERESASVAQSILLFACDASPRVISLVSVLIQQQLLLNECKDPDLKPTRALMPAELLCCVLHLLRGLPIEVDNKLFNKMIEVSLLEWIPDLSYIAHLVRLHMWVPSLLQISDTCWSLALELGERKLPQYFTFLRSLTTSDENEGQALNRLAALLATPASLCSAEEKVQKVLTDAPDTWFQSIEQKQHALHERRLAVRRAYRAGGAARGELHSQLERSWDEARDYLARHNTPIDSKVMKFCEAVYDEAHRLLKDTALTESDKAQRFKRFREEYYSNYYVNRGRKQRTSLQAVQKRDRELWENKAKLRHVLVTVFLAFHQGKYKPYRVQVLAVVALLCNAKSALANISTGEGKTYISGCFAAVKAYVGYAPLLFSSNNALAKESYESHAPAWRLLFMGQKEAADNRSAFTCRVEATETDSRIRMQCYAHHIIYSTLFDVIGDHLRAVQYPEEWTLYRQWSHSPRWFLLDEADTVMAGSVSDAVYIGNPQLSFFKEILGFPSLLSSVRTEAPVAGAFIDYKKEVKRLCFFLDDKALSTARFSRLYKSAQSTGAVRNNADFVNKDASIAPYDIANGTLQLNSHWNHGLGNLVSILEGARLVVETDSMVSMAPFVFLEEMKDCLTGITGTVGNEMTRIMYKHVYNMDCWVMPPAFESQMLELIPRVAYSRREQLKLAAESTKRFLEEGQSCLIVQNTIVEMVEVKKCMEKEFGGRLVAPKDIREYASEQDERPTLDTVTGKPSIICATLRGGRGLDIAINNCNGLAVLLLSPQEERNTTQAERRAARQNDNGSAQRIFLAAHRRNPLLLESLDEFKVDPARDQNGYYTGTDERVLRKQRMMMESFYAVQNEVIANERRRLCKLLQLSIPVTCFMKVLQSKMWSIYDQIAVALPNQAARPQRRAHQRLLQCRYAEWMKANEENVREDGNQPLTQQAYLDDLMNVLHTVWPLSQASGKGGDADDSPWSGVLRTATDEDDIIQIASAVSFDATTRTGVLGSCKKKRYSLFSEFDAKQREKFKGEASYSHGTMPLCLAFEKAAEGSYASKASMNDIRMHIQVFITYCERMQQALEVLKRNMESFQTNVVDIRTENDLGTLGQIAEWVDFLRLVLNYCTELVGYDGIVGIEDVARLYNTEEMLSSREAVSIVSLLVRKGILEVHAKSASAPLTKEEELKSFEERLADGMEIAKTTFAGGAAAFVEQFRQKRKSCSSDTLALLHVLAGAFEGALDVSTCFHKAVRNGHVGPLRVHADFFHGHNEDYERDIELLLKGSDVESIYRSVAALCTQLVGTLRAEQVDTLSITSLKNAVPRVKKNPKLMDPFRMYGFHYTLNVTPYVHCKRKRDEIEAQNKWYRKLWRAVCAVAKFAAFVLISAAFDVLFSYVTKLITIGLDTVKFAYNALKDRIQTGQWNLKAHAKALGMSILRKAAPQVLKCITESNLFQKALSSHIGQCAKGAYDWGKSIVQSGVESVGRVTAPLRQRLNDFAETLSDATGFTKVLTGVESCVQGVTDTMGDGLGVFISVDKEDFKDRLYKATLSNMNELAVEQVSSSVSQFIMHYTANKAVDDTMELVSKTLTQEAIHFVRAVKRQVKLKDFGVFTEKFFAMIEEKGTMKLLESVLSVTGSYMREQFYAGRDTNGDTLSGQGTVYAAFGTLASLKSHWNARNVMFGSDEKKQEVAHDKLVAALDEMWKWAEQKYKVRRTKRDKGVQLSPEASEVQFVEALLKMVRDQCAAPIQRIFDGVARAAVTLVSDVSFEVKRREEARRLELEKRKGLEWVRGGVPEGLFSPFRCLEYPKEATRHGHKIPTQTVKASEAMEKAIRVASALGRLPPVPMGFFRIAHVALAAVSLNEDFFRGVYSAMDSAKKVNCYIREMGVNIPSFDATAAYKTGTRTDVKPKALKKKGSRKKKEPDDPPPAGGEKTDSKGDGSGKPPEPDGKTYLADFAKEDYFHIRSFNEMIGQTLPPPPPPQSKWGEFKSRCWSLARKAKNGARVIISVDPQTGQYVLLQPSTYAAAVVKGGKMAWDAAKWTANEVPHLVERGIHKGVGGVRWIIALDNTLGNKIGVCPSTIAVCAPCVRLGMAVLKFAMTVPTCLELATLANSIYVAGFQKTSVQFTKYIWTKALRNINKKSFCSLYQMRWREAFQSGGYVNGIFKRIPESAVAEAVKEYTKVEVIKKATKNVASTVLGSELGGELNEIIDFCGSAYWLREDVKHLFSQGKNLKKCLELRNKKWVDAQKKKAFGAHGATKSGELDKRLTKSKDAFLTSMKNHPYYDSTQVVVEEVTDRYIQSVPPYPCPTSSQATQGQQQPQQQQEQQQNQQANSTSEKATAQQPSKQFKLPSQQQQKLASRETANPGPALSTAADKSTGVHASTTDSYMATSRSSSTFRTHTDTSVRHHVSATKQREGPPDTRDTAATPSLRKTRRLPNGISYCRKYERQQHASCVSNSAEGRESHSDTDDSAYETSEDENEGNGSVSSTEQE